MMRDKIIKRINSILGIVIPRFEQSKEIITKSNGVICHRLPMLKIIPRRIIGRKKIEQQYNKIEFALEKKDFIPDIVVGHWENPQIQLLAKMKDRWKVRTSLVFHALVYIKQKRYVEYLKKQIKTIDIIGIITSQNSKMFLFFITQKSWI